MIFLTEKIQQEEMEKIQKEDLDIRAELLLFLKSRFKVYIFGCMNLTLNSFRLICVVLCLSQRVTNDVSSPSCGP